MMMIHVLLRRRNYYYTVSCRILLLLFTSSLLVTAQTQQDGFDRLHLNGETHLRITVAEEPGFIDSNKDNGNSSGYDEYSGYLIDVLKAISKPERGNFTYELRSPSGYGSLCVPQLIWDNSTNNYNSTNITTTNITITTNMTNTTTTELLSEKAYSNEYATQYNCAQSDVTDPDMPPSITTDIYLGLFYIIPRRLRISQFTTPLNPPLTGRMVMYGYATEIQDLDDFVRQQQQASGVRDIKPACVMKSTANVEFLREVYPTLRMEEISPTDESILNAFHTGICELAIYDYVLATQFVYNRWKNNECLVNGKPIGIIGEPMKFGPTYHAWGIRDDISNEVVKTLDYWLTILMTCNDNDEGGLCQGDSLLSLYNQGFKGGSGTGKECGYINYPAKESKRQRLLPPWAIAIIIMITFGLMIIGMVVYYFYQLRRQRHRIKLRFVWQIARNIEIGSSPGMIPAEKLVEEVQHIGGRHNGYITKDDLSKWICDVKMTFLSQKDFDALWTAMDVDGKGVVDPIEFFVFLGSCGSEFNQVYTEQQQLPKVERLKLAARRLTNIREMGEEGVRRSENSIERRARKAVGLNNPNLSSDSMIPAKSTRRLNSTISSSASPVSKSTRRLGSTMLSSTVQSSSSSRPVTKSLRKLRSQASKTFRSQKSSD